MRAPRRERAAHVDPHARRRRGERGALGRGVPARRAPACDTAFVGRALPQADDRPSARLYLHLGHPGGGRGLRAFHARARRAGSADPQLVEPVRLPAPGAALPAEGPAARAERRRLHRGGHPGGAAGAARERRTGVSSVHHAARPAPRARAAARPAAVPAARAGHRVAQRAARALSHAGQRGAAGQPVVLGGRGRARRGAVAGDHRQAAFCSAGRPGARGAHRRHTRAGRQSLHCPAAAAGGAAAQAGRRAADSRRGRPRRADAVRSAPLVQALRPAHPAQPAADEAHPPPGGSAKLLRRSPGMKVLVTGGGGFLGARLARKLLERGELGGQRISGITVLDSKVSKNAALRVVEGDLADPAVLDKAVETDTAAVFHLAAVVSGAAEAEFDLGMRVNLDGTRRLLEKLRGCERPPRVVFASSVAAFGGELPEVLDDATTPRPQTSYGTQKVIGEYLVSDFTRKGYIDGRSLRLPTIVVRAGKPNAAASSFASGVIREPLSGAISECPVAPETGVWLLSPRRVVEAFIHALELPPQAWGANRVVNLPGITVTVAQMLER